MNLLKKLSFLFLIILISAISFSCKEKFRQVNSKELHSKWQDAINHSAVSWWYLGEENGFYYILEKWPLKEEGYKIEKKQINILIEKPLNLTSNKSEWVNLKKHHLSFN